MSLRVELGRGAELKDANGLKGVRGGGSLVCMALVRGEGLALRIASVG